MQWLVVWSSNDCFWISGYPDNPDDFEKFSIASNRTVLFTTTSSSGLNEDKQQQYKQKTKIVIITIEKTTLHCQSKQIY